MKKYIWGSSPDFWGPRDWFRNTLLINEIKKIKSKGKVLDYGCGNGNLLIRLAALNYDCLGIDPSVYSIKNLNQKITTQKIRKIKTQVGSEKELVKYKNKFDIVILGESLEHIKNDKRTIEKLYRTLKPKGTCVISVPAYMSRWTKADEYAGHYRRYDMKELTTLVVNSGFKVNKVYYWGFPVTYIWDKWIMIPRFLKQNQFSNQKNRFNFAHDETLKKGLAYFFEIDKLFNWSRLGNGLILVASR